MEYVKYYLFISNIINLISIFHTSYLYSEFNRTFRNINRVSITLSFKDFSGFLLYAIDSDRNRLLIQSENSYETKKINFNFNENLYNKSVTPLANYSANQLDVILKFEENGLQYDQNLHLFKIFPQNTTKNSFARYPIPKDIEKYQNKTYFWIGNIGPYIGDYDKTVEPFNTTAFGCVNKIIIDITFGLELKNESKYFSKSCLHMYKERLCDKDQCKMIQTSEHFLDCSLFALNTNIMCYNDLLQFGKQSQIFERNSDLIQSTSFKIVWKQKQLKNFCLSEIDMKDGSQFIFYLNKNNELSQCFINHKLRKCNSTRFLFNITLNVIHVLLLTFEYSHIIIKISNGEYIQTFEDKAPTDIKKIKIGISEHSDNCVKFQGELTFRYDLSQFNSLCLPENFENSFEFYFHIFFGSIILMTLLCTTLCIIQVKLKSNVPHQSFERKSPYMTNNHETTDIINIPLRPLPEPNENLENYYGYVESSIYSQPNIAERTKPRN